MKIIFLDIDGVLNSVMYEPYTDELGVFYFVDESRLALLGRVVALTGAKIVLTSTWRDTWDKDPAKCDGHGRYLNAVFAKYGLRIYDKTADSGNYWARREEVLDWMKGADERIESFVILDDDRFDWKELGQNAIVTDPRHGHGLEPEHALRAVEILSK